MKKLFAGLLAAFLLTAGLVAATGSPAQAACGNPQYPACFETKTGLTVSPTGNGPARRTFKATVRAVGTTARPVGTVTFRFKRVGGGVSFATRTLGSTGRVTITRKFKPGKYNVTATFTGKNGSIFDDSKSGNRQFRVKR
ncbi:Ig-like domain repeat protein [Nocardioides rubriscoriae]|uniref:Ig-like domain repeat protein n=1 Tax=Nocardioides rubriscoriae TaxID=642762 RepID=UPI0011E0389A|nr:Ig-like domain repeat protein [Nocardioides rubriscoriae]